MSYKEKIQRIKLLSIKLEEAFLYKDSNISELGELLLDHIIVNLTMLLTRKTAK